MLKQRVITAVVMILLLGAGILLLPPVWLAGLFALVVIVASWEWAGLSGLNAWPAKAAYALLVAGLMALACGYSQLLSERSSDQPVRDVLGLGCLWWAIALLWVKSFPASAVIWRPVLMRLLMGLLVLIPAWVAFVFLRLHSHGVAFIFVLIAIVTTADIGAYFSGKAWGKSKLAPNVSPGKSWAGFWGGLAASSVLALLLWLTLGLLMDSSAFELTTVIAVAVVTSLASVLGDLLESMVKREQGVKDSGRILPGHGGLMDRIDSMTAAAPVFALCLLLAGW